jgi:UDP-N-acetylenolpyruvoylglucosamine reductase
MKKITRKEFARLSTLTGLALLLEPFKGIGNTLMNQLYTNGSDNVVYIRKEDASYETLRRGYNMRINRYPKIIALCMNTNGVSEAMRYAKENKLPVAVKSGGHCMEGFSGSDGGMVINLSKLNDMEWNDSSHITIGPGCTLSKMYDELLPKGKIIPGGSCAGVGIGGLTLGGGYGLMSRRFGLTCDSLTGITMVDGEGNIHEASGNDELMWACRGGGNGNFGVVTKMKFKVHEAPKTMESFRFRAFNMTAAQAKEKMETWFGIAATLPKNCFSAFLLNRKTVYILLTNTGARTTAVKNAIASLKGITTKFTETAPQPLAKALKTYYASPVPLEFKNASAGLYKEFSEIEGCIESALEIVTQSTGMIFQVNTVGGEVLQSGSSYTSCFPHRDCIFFSELQTEWGSAAGKTKLVNNFERVQQLFAAHGIKTQYRNYPDVNFKNHAAQYYGSSLTRLQEFKKKYDPDNRVRHEQSIR